MPQIEIEVTARRKRILEALCLRNDLARPEHELVTAITRTKQE